MTMKIYTKTGDTGKTSLLGGTRVQKHSQRIEAYGTADELNAWIGLLHTLKIKKRQKGLLIEIQDRLFTLGAQLALDPKKAGTSKMKLPTLKEEDVLFLENEIDFMEERLTPMTSFVLPGGAKEVAYCHIARCVCRRLERHISDLSQQEQVDPLVLKYINRLSDFLFVLSRQFAVQLKAKETPWKPRVS